MWGLGILPARLIIIHEGGSTAAGGDGALLRFALSSEPTASVVLDGLMRIPFQTQDKASISRVLPGRGRSEITLAVPEKWNMKPCAAAKVVTYAEGIPIDSGFRREIRRYTWLVVSDGRFTTRIKHELVDRVLAGSKADVAMVNVRPELSGYREKVRLTAEGKIVGFRRQHVDSVEPAPQPVEWPNHLFVRTEALGSLLCDGALPRAFSVLLERCRSGGLTLQCVSVGGAVLNLETEDGLLNCCTAVLSDSRTNRYPWTLISRANGGACGRDNGISKDARFIGNVLLGEGVHIGSRVIVVGPTIVGSGARIAEGSTVDSSIIGSGASIPNGRLVRHRVVKPRDSEGKRAALSAASHAGRIRPVGFEPTRWHKPREDFRSWPRFSYARTWKRVADVFAAVVVLILFAPIMPLVALAIKLSSPGPVFFKDKRQGLHGKLFDCLKFRTMLVGAAEIQDKLRVVSQVDGPQFKMADDPRLNAVGMFLRETYLDEIPQFFNVLLGQMSVVGPRPSPEAENTLCPYWRDARLSVRPGITGLWQVYRTREPMRDFQEWIHYDTGYVKDLSLRMDLSICWRTTKRMVDNFISQF